MYTPVYLRVFLLSLPVYPCPIYFSMHRASCSQTRADSPPGAWARTKDSEERPLQKHLYRWVAWQLADYQGMTVSEIPWAVSFCSLPGGLRWSWNTLNCVSSVFPIPAHSLPLLGLKCGILGKRWAVNLATY